MLKRLRSLVRLGVAGIFSGSIILLTCSNVQASNLMELVYTSEETTDSYSEAYNTPKERGNCLAFGSAKITRQSSDEVRLYGLTQGITDCDLLSLSMSLERKVDGVYSTYQMWDFYGDNTYELSKTIYVLVPKESFYRLRTYHSAKIGVTKESTSVLTKGIYIGDDA